MDNTTYNTAYPGERFQSSIVHNNIHAYGANNTEHHVTQSKYDRVNYVEDTYWYTMKHEVDEEENEVCKERD